jgi:AtzE family amidohydrolase
VTAEPAPTGAAALAGAVRSGALSAREVLEPVLERVAAVGAPLNAFRVVTAARARREAAAVDATVAAGGDPGPLAGVPYGVKDLFDLEGLPTAAGSRIGEEGPPASRDAALVSRLRAAGAVLLGLQVMDQYAYGFTTENADHGAVHNPRDLARSAGGSSGGSAAAVAAGLGAFALGSDTNGSIRVPASFCGVFGLKPTFGRLPRTGTFPFVFDLDHLGVFARGAHDLALVYDVLQGPDPDDPGCAPRPAQPALGTLGQELAGLRVGVLDGWFDDMADDQGRAAVARAADALGASERVTLTGAQVARSAAFLLSAASGANLHRANLSARPQDFDPAVRGRLLAGALLPAAEVQQAQRVRRQFYAETMAVFSRFDLLLAPATPCTAPLLGQAEITLGGRQVPSRPNIGVLTQPLSAIGLPIVAAPVHEPGALPIAVQIVAPPWREDLALQVAARLERVGVASAPVAEPCA